MSGIFWLLKAIVEFARDLWQSAQEKKKDRQLQHEKRVAEAERAIAKGDGDALTGIVDDHLRWLQSNGKADRGGSGDPKN
jgi:hypothetical protein